MRYRIAIIGDLMIDADNIVSEKKTREDRDCLIIENRVKRLGTSGAVAHMVAALGLDPILIGIANLEEVPAVRRMAGCTCHILGSQADTTRRERFYLPDWTVAGPRVDYNSPKEVSEEDQIYLAARAIGCAADAFIVCDHGRGVVGPLIMDKLKKTGKPIFVDPHSTSDFELFSGVECLCLNREEALAATDAQPSPKNIMQKIDADGLWWYREGWLFAKDGSSDCELCNGFGLERINSNFDVNKPCTKCGGSGKNKRQKDFDDFRLYFPSMAIDVVDTLGAGDQFIATLACARVRGDNWEPAIVQAMSAAGLQCEQRGIVPIGWESIHERMNGKLDPGGNVRGTADQGGQQDDNVPRLLGGN